jgi:hypothetical protein
MGYTGTTGCSIPEISAFSEERFVIEKTVHSLSLFQNWKARIPELKPDNSGFCSILKKMKNTAVVG